MHRVLLPCGYPCLLILLLLAETNAAPPASAPAAGRILCQYWRQIPGTLVSDLTGSASYPKFPSEQVYLDRLEIPPNQENDFGTVIRGWLHPPQDGQYTFFIAGDDQCELWLSPDDNPAHMARIAQVPEWSLPRAWEQDAGQKSAPVTLAAGRRYYIEARHKDGGGDNSLAVAWRLPDATFEGPIPGHRLSPADPVVVPPPSVVAGREALPTAPGNHRIELRVDYRGEQLSIPVLLTLPARASSTGRRPAIVFLPDDEQAADADGMRLQGPSRELSANPALATWSPFIVLSPQCPPGQTRERQTFAPAVAAAIDHLLSALGADRERIYLTGAGTGGTAVWRLALHMPGKFAAIVPICGWDLHAPALPGRLEGSTVRIITGVKNGMATDRANRMKDFLSSVRPAVRIDYQMEMGSEVADHYYARKDFYEWLLTCPAPGGQSASPAPLAAARRDFPSRWAWLGGVAVAVGGVAVIGMRLRRRATAPHNNPDAPRRP